MTPENVGKRDKIEICYHPKDIIDFLEKRGPFTSKELRSDFGYNEEVTHWIIMDLMGLSIVDSSDEDWRYDEEDQTVHKVYHLTEEGKQRKDSFKVRRAVLTPMPSFSRLSMEVANDVFRAANNLGMSLEELVAKVRSGDLDEKIQQRVFEILREFSGGELRSLARERGLFSRGLKPSDQLPLDK